MRTKPHTETLVMSPPTIKLFTHSLCPYAHRASLALCEKGLQPEAFESHIDLSNKPKEFLRLNPRGLVPAMQIDDGEIMTESSNIIVHIDEILDRGSLTQGAARDEILEFVSEADRHGGFISSGLSFVGGGWGFRRGMPRASQVEQFEKTIAGLDTLLRSSGGDYLFGSTVSLADIVIYPFAERFQLACREFQGYELGEAQNAEAFVVWLAMMAARDSVKALRPNDEKLLASWRRTERLDYFDYETADRENP